MQEFRIALLTLGTLVLASEAGASAFSIDDWFLGVTVADLSTGEDESDGFYNVQNPFQNSHAVSVGDSTSEASYDFAWSPHTGTLLVEAAHQAEFVDSATLVSSSSGSIDVFASVDLTLGLTGAYTYDLPPDSMLARFQMAVLDLDTSETLFVDTQVDDTFDGYPAAGTFTIDGEVTLPAGHSYSLKYWMRIDTWVGPPEVFGTGSGWVNFQIIPEPATATLLLLPAAVLVCRRHRLRGRRRTGGRGAHTAAPQSSPP
jgi:hypothetical protein